MAIRIIDHQLPDYTHNHHYDVPFFQDTISTTVTNTPSSVDAWITDIERIHHRRLRFLVVGLDVKCRPRRRLNPASGPRRRRNPENHVATLQLCVGRRCLIFQILHSPSVPQSLINFLANPSYTFTGFGIHNGAQKLAQDHNLVVGNMQDLGTLAADVYGVEELKHARMKELVVRILGREVCRPKRIIRSKWYDEWLTMAQVQFACIDAFLSFEIGRILMAGNRN